MTVFTIEIMQGCALLPLTTVIIDCTALIDTRHPQSLRRHSKFMRSIWQRYDALATFIDHSLKGDVVPCLGDDCVPASQGLNKARRSYSMDSEMVTRQHQVIHLSRTTCLLRGVAMLTAKR